MFNIFSVLHVTEIYTNEDWHISCLQVRRGSTSYDVNHIYIIKLKDLLLIVHCDVVKCQL